ncbi:hypothetical protein E4U55_006243 [Claviceps digitariae]|nr:hypothetical protein E4U55_006243 [Claviceps digitariae]
MPRISRVRRLASLQLAVPAPLPSRTPFANACRAISTTCAARGKNTDWARKKLFKGEPPGGEDPYTQRAEPEAPSNLPDEALHQPRPAKIPAAVLNSRLILPPRRTEAALEKDAALVDPSYVPATEATSLLVTPPLKIWWDLPGHWGEESHFEGFGNSEKVVDRNVMEVYLRQSVTEAVSQQQQTGSSADWSTKKWREVSRSQLDRILAADLVVKDGKASLGSEDAAFISQCLAVKEANEAYEDAAAEVAPEEAREMVWAWDASWKELVVDEQLKFAIRKRLYQLTGVLIPDAKLGAARTVKHLLTLVVKKPTPKKLAEVLEQRSDIQQLANVKVHSRKIGPIEKETSVGRWKVIEKELTKRGLPVTGTAGLSKNRERDWITGKY